ncbi:MAG: Kynurenine formamidase [Euryarchaeota archaeon ADurb.BinA087]|nr:cyclase family protein [Methanoregulaceae archaeon]OPZ43244.1 MAG: Kynurenine formamidase [Euryarchaeota archaeon ADurb.BinA087]
MSKNGRIYDITRPLAPGCIVYPGDIVPGFAQEDHGNYLITEIRISSHSGTHIDAPSHYLEMGASVDQIPLTHLMGWCRVIDLTHVQGEIKKSDLEEKIRGAKKVLLKTSFSERNEFVEDYPSFGIEAAEFLAARRIHCVGTDAPSIEEYKCNGSVHRTLLSAGMVIIEMLDLWRIPEGDYWMIALPLRLSGLDGSPCRVLLFEGWEVEPPSWTLYEVQ